MTVTKSFPWKKLILFVLISLGALVYYDSNQSGGFAKSSTKHFLKDTGLLDYGQIALKHTVIYTRKAVHWIQEHGPVYYSIAREFLQPYCELAHDLFLISRNAFEQLKEYVIERVPVVIAFIESYAPGLIDKVVEISQFIGSQAIKYFEIARHYLATKVFVGQLSPDNLQKATMVAFNTTQQYATRYYDWVYQMISSID